MSTTRRRFLQAGGVSLVAASAGCRRSPLGFLPGSGYVDAVFDARVGVAPQGERPDAVSHVLSRLTFGPRPGEYARVRGLGTTVEEAAAAFVEEQLQPESIDDAEAEEAVERLPTLIEPLGELFEYHDHVLLRELVHGTLLRAVYSRRQLFEVMVHFWTDHFNIDASKGDAKWLKVWDDREVIRRYALAGPVVGGGSIAGAVGRWFLGRDGEESGRGARRAGFRDLLRASALSPAMLWYLDGRENAKRRPQDRPNENYARELLELHTLGVHGGYTQQDVMEVARCLTGWTVRPRQGGFLAFGAGAVEFRPDRHDDGAKVVLGERIPAGLGAGDLERVIEIVAGHRATAEHLARKLCRRFIGDEPAPAAERSVAAAFLRSAGDIRESLRVLFRTPEFLQAPPVKLRRPFHFVAAALRATDASLARSCDRKNDGALLRYLRSLGHVPFDYPTPDGYPEEGAPWMGTLLWRWKFALALAGNRVAEARVDSGRLLERAGGFEALAAMVLGRDLSAEERGALAGVPVAERLGLLLASPAFQVS